MLPFLGRYQETASPGLALDRLACVAVIERGRGRGNLGVRAGHAGYCPLGN